MRKREIESPTGSRPPSPFTQEALNMVFKVSPKDPQRLNSREGYRLEFKKAFNWGNRASYARTFLAFANTRGGYMVFGVNPKPHTMVGLQNARFEEIDPSTIDEFLCECANPSVQWDVHVHEFAGHTFGLIYVHEHSAKPVICRKTFGDSLGEGEIYYRYRARTRKIRFAELREIIDAIRKHENTAWLHLLQRIARIGVREAGIFDLSSGEVSGTGGSFIIDESLLSQLTFIREDALSQAGETPAVKIVGEAEPVRTVYVSSGKEIVRTRGIRAPTIITDFLKGTRVDNPGEYVRQICFESTAFLPVYFYMREARLSRHSAAALLQDVKSTSQAKGRLIRRLRTEEDLSLPLPSSSYRSGEEKLDYRTRLLEKESGLGGRVTPDKAKYLLQALRTLAASELDKRYITAEVKTLYDRFYGKERTALTYELRYAICFLDATWYAPPKANV